MTTYKYYNQYNYKNIPYPSSELPNATVASGGCGVCCGAMIISNLTSNIVDPIAMAKYSISHKARVNGGTDMNVLAKAICADYNLEFTITNDENILINHLKSGGMAIANVGGNSGNYIGVFSNGGHFIVVAGLTSDGKIIVLDPGYYLGKFNVAGRKGKVTVNGNNCICGIDILGKDTENRSPAYWLFNKKNIIKEVLEVFKDVETNRWSAKSIQRLVDLGILSGYADNTFRPAQPLTREEFAFALDNVLKLLGK